MRRDLINYNGPARGARVGEACAPCVREERHKGLVELAEELPVPAVPLRGAHLSALFKHCLAGEPPAAPQLRLVERASVPVRLEGVPVDRAAVNRGSREEEV